MRKNIFIACAVFLVLEGTFGFAQSASAQTVADLQAQIQALLAQIAQLQAKVAELQGGGSPAWCHTFNTNLRFGDNNAEVGALRTALVKEGFPGLEAMGGAWAFDERIASAVVGFQQKYASEILTPLGLKHGTGYVGVATRAKLNSLYGCGVPKPVPPPPPVQPSIKVLSPNGGEQWVAGKSYTIIWEGTRSEKGRDTYFDLIGVDNSNIYPLGITSIGFVVNRNEANVSVSQFVRPGKYTLQMLMIVDGVRVFDNSDGSITVLAANKLSPCNNLGDVNSDGFVTKDDVNLILDYVVQKRTFTTAEFARADVNGDKAVNILDSTQVLQYIEGKINSFSGCTNTGGGGLLSPRTTYLVKPYLVYPADKPAYPEYESAVKNYMSELQKWYLEKVGVTFVMNPLEVVKSPYNYLTIRCGENPSESCKNDPKKLDGNIGFYMNKAIHNGLEKWDEQTATLVFSAGAGGYAGSNKYPNDTGWAIVGDWVLEPISGIPNNWGIPCSYSDGWQCSGGVPKGTPAHELAHAFGLPHPDGYGGQSIMKWHGDYPAVGFLPHEIELLRNSPFFK